MTDWKSIIGNILFVMGVILTFSAVLYQETITETKNVKCFDRNSNEIIGLDCKEKVSPLYLQIILVFGLTTMLIGFLTTVLSLFNPYEYPTYSIKYVDEKQKGERND